MCLSPLKEVGGKERMKVKSLLSGQIRWGYRWKEVEVSKDCWYLFFGVIAHFNDEYIARMLRG